MSPFSREHDKIKHVEHSVTSHYEQFKQCIVNRLRALAMCDKGLYKPLSHIASYMLTLYTPYNFIHSAVFQHDFRKFTQNFLKALGKYPNYKGFVTHTCPCVSHRLVAPGYRRTWTPPTHPCGLMTRIPS